MYFPWCIKNKQNLDLAKGFFVQVSLKYIFEVSSIISYGFMNSSEVSSYIYIKSSLSLSKTALNNLSRILKSAASTKKDGSLR